jgi:predicted GIY-YIG superfamily endonuclease
VDREAELYSGRYFVDILPTRPTGADKVELQFAFVDFESRRDFKHTPSILAKKLFPGKPCLRERAGASFIRSEHRDIGMTVYLLHFERPVYGHSQHYIGFTTNLAQRLASHKYGHGARITSIAVKKGIRWELARVWEGEDQEFERLLKKSGRARKYCQICSPRAEVDLP